MLVAFSQISYHERQTKFSHTSVSLSIDQLIYEMGSVVSYVTSEKWKHSCLAKGKHQLLALDTTTWKCHAVSLDLFTTCGHWPIPVKWWGRHWGCIKEPFSIMAHTLLTCTLTLERASKRKHSETYECHSQCKTRSKLATSMALLKTWFICDKLEGNVSKSSTIQSDNREWEMATRLQNQVLFAK